MTSEDGKDEYSQNLVLHKLVHYQQRFSWDCGVACVMMLLEQEQRLYFLQNFSAICQEEGFNQSTWTIDLCYLLKRFGIEHTMYTTMLGVNEDYKKHSYYDRISDLDRERVRGRFRSALSSGVRVVRGALPVREVARHVLTRGPALLLLDAARLVCHWCGRDQLTAELRGYRGHYVLVVGVRGSALLYRDPAHAAPRLCCAPTRALHRAHHAPGTDHDVILINRDYTSSGSSRAMTFKETQADKL